LSSISNYLTTVINLFDFKLLIVPESNARVQSSGIT